LTIDSNSVVVILDYVQVLKIRYSNTIL